MANSSKQDHRRRRQPQLHLETAARSTCFFAIAEIDRFDLLRARMCYHEAEALLAQFQREISELVDGARIARAGRTRIEFLFAAADEVEAQARLERLVRDFSRPLTIAGFAFQANLVIGAAKAEDDLIDERIFECATNALGQARLARSAVTLVCAKECQQTIADTRSILEELAAAIRDDALELHYQPKYHARSGRIESVEALLRWYRPAGLFDTAALIDLCEDTAVIGDLTRWAVNRAKADQERLLASGCTARVFMNLSGSLIHDERFVDWIRIALAGREQYFGFEVTETAVIEDPLAGMKNLDLLVEAGFPIAIDDYGTGLSSLAYLKQFPASELKIDRMFIEGLTGSNRDPLLVRSSIDLAHALDMQVTAEGVSDQMTFALLRVMGCDIIQGYFIAKPMPIDALCSFLNEEQAHLSLAVDMPTVPLGAASRAS